MNNFTKEELEFLKLSINMIKINNYGLYGNSYMHWRAKEIYDKLQLMIDTYRRYRKENN